MRTIKIFIVEDNNLYSLVLEHKLKALANFQLRHFRTAEDSLENLYQSPDMIIMDYHLPGMNGLEAYRQVKKTYPKLPVVFLSGEKDPELAQKCKDEGAREFIVKDEYAPEKLFQAISTISTEEQAEGQGVINNLFSGLKKMMASFF